MPSGRGVAGPDKTVRMGEWDRTIITGENRMSSFLIEKIDDKIPFILGLW
jgi:hypothetical protein